MASALPVATAAVAWSWPLYGSTLIAGLPASLQAACRFGRSSSCCTVPVCTATFSPQAASGATFFGLPLAVAHWVPAL